MYIYIYKSCDRKYQVDARPIARIFRRGVMWMSCAFHEHISLKENLDAMHKVTHCTGCISVSCTEVTGSWELHA